MGDLLAAGVGRLGLGRGAVGAQDRQLATTIAAAARHRLVAIGQTAAERDCAHQRADHDNRTRSAASRGLGLFWILFLVVAGVRAVPGRHLMRRGVGIGGIGAIRIVVGVAVILPVAALRRIAVLGLLGVVARIVLGRGIVPALLRGIAAGERAPIGIVPVRLMPPLMPMPLMPVPLTVRLVRLAELLAAIAAVGLSLRTSGRRRERLEARAEGRRIRPQRAEDVPRRATLLGRMAILLAWIVLRRIGVAVSVGRLGLIVRGVRRPQVRTRTFR